MFGSICPNENNQFDLLKKGAKLCHHDFVWAWIISLLSCRILLQSITSLYPQWNILLLHVLSDGETREICKFSAQIQQRKDSFCCRYLQLSELAQTTLVEMALWSECSFSHDVTVWCIKIDGWKTGLASWHAGNNMPGASMETLFFLLKAFSITGFH